MEDRFPEHWNSLVELLKLRLTVNGVLTVRAHLVIDGLTELYM